MKPLAALGGSVLVAELNRRSPPAATAAGKSVFRQLDFIDSAAPVHGMHWPCSLL